MKKRNIAVISILLTFISYTIIGTNENVKEIKRRVPLEVKKRGWKILRYEGFEFGSWNRHGGKVWYHVSDLHNPNIQYRVNVSMWGNELQWYYGQPEDLTRIEINK